MAKRRKLRGWYFSWGGSLAFHAILLIAIAFWVLDADDYFLSDDSRFEGSQVSSLEDTPAGQASDGQRIDDEEKQPSAEAVEKHLGGGEKWAESLSPPAKMRELKKRIPKLDKIAAETVDKLASLAETFYGVDKQRAYAAQADVPGRFDTNTAVLCDITRQTHKGRTVYVHTLVDSKGRSLQARRLGSEMTRGDLRTYRIFKYSRSNPKLRRLIDAAIRIGETKIKSSHSRRKEPRMDTNRH